MKVIKTQKDVLPWLEEQAKALSHDKMVLAHDHVACGDFLKTRWDEVALYQLRASAERHAASQWDARQVRDRWCAGLANDLIQACYSSLSPSPLLNTIGWIEAIGCAKRHNGFDSAIRPDITIGCTDYFGMLVLK
jgi:hypothetical protein